MLRTMIGAWLLVFLATVMMRTRNRNTAAYAGSPGFSPARRRIHPGLTGAGAAERWDLEGDGSVIRSHAY